MRKLRAKPDPTTKMLTAVCLNCDGVLYKRPNQPWIHDDNEDNLCHELEED